MSDVLYFYLLVVPEGQVVDFAAKVCGSEVWCVLLTLGDRAMPFRTACPLGIRCTESIFGLCS